MQDVMLHELYGNALKMNRVGIELGVDISSVIDVEPLPFKEGSADVKYEVMVELDKIVAFMVENPTISIRLRSHTGSRGSSRDNLDLSSRRARAAVDYIVAQGIQSSRISGVGVGEKEIINHCRDGVDCTEGEHKENERTQYIITKN
jgi:outer membrane protein OmpA-like peptidoglycan-associated protein